LIEQINNTLNHKELEARIARYRFKQLKTEIFDDLLSDENMFDDLPESHLKKARARYSLFWNNILSYVNYD
jgi:hypothetical protein